MDHTEILNELNFIIDSYLKESLKKYHKQHYEQNGGDILIGGKSTVIRTLPPLSKKKSMSLSKYGYTLTKSSINRQKALKKAAKVRGTLSVLKRVNLISNYSKSVPKNHSKLRSDVEYLKNKYAKEKLSKYM